MGRAFHLALIFLAVTACATQPAISQPSAADRPLTFSVTFELFHDYLIVVQGSIGPLKGLNFLVDTGATPSVLDPRVAAKLHLDAVPTDIAVLQGTARGAMATLPSLRVGPVGRTNFPVLVQDLGFVQKVLPLRLDGIVGLDVLGQSPFVIDYASRTIRFGSAELPSSVPLAMSQGRAMLSAEVNNRPVQLLLDTGAPALVLFRPAGAAGAAAARVSSASIGEHDHRLLHLDSLRVGSATIPHPSALLVASRIDTGHDFAGILSPAALGFRQIGIDLLRGELAFSMKR